MCELCKCLQIWSQFIHIFKSQEPNERLLGQTILPNSSGTHQRKCHYCYDIPFLESLQLLLRNKEIQQQVSLV